MKYVQNLIVEILILLPTEEKEDKKRGYRKRKRRGSTVSEWVS